MGSWTFGQKVGAGFAVIVALTILVGVISVVALGRVIADANQVVSTYGDNMVDASRLNAMEATRAAAMRGFLLGGDERYVAEVTAARQEFSSALETLKRRVTTPEETQKLRDIEKLDSDHYLAAQRVLELRRKDSTGEAAQRAWDSDMVPLGDQKRRALSDFEDRERSLRQTAWDNAQQAAGAARWMTSLCVLVASLLAIFIATFLTRSLTRQIGSAVGRVQSSSAELQAVANQQATGAREQATAMNEIATTISELLATSRQIAESAQRVSGIADQTASAASTGDSTVLKANESISGIRRQVDQVVHHMLELGRKSQQIGAVLDIVSELAEQTNILAINATIEAAGAGEAGKRFSVVADEIRKLADRVGGSTKEVRALIEDVRNAVNTTVMATETGSKAVDSGNRQFAEVTSALRQISALVQTTTDAAREIELSTKQQTSAVEQVNVAIANVAQASRENEASTGQTLQTAQQLNALSGDLMRVVHSG